MHLAVTPEQSRDARDAEDALLLETGDHEALLAAYFPVIRQRCLLNVRGDAAADVAQNVCLRLAAELCRGRRYRVPFRVVVHRCITWKIQEHLSGIRSDLPIPPDWDAVSSGDPYAEVEDDYDLHQLFSGLPEGDREVAELRY